MTNSANPEDRAGFAVCVDNSGYAASLELRKIYAVIADASAARDGEIRIVDESGEDYLYPAARFVPIDLPEALERAMFQIAS